MPNGGKKIILTLVLSEKKTGRKFVLRKGKQFLLH